MLERKRTHNTTRAWSFQWPTHSCSFLFFSTLIRLISFLVPKFEFVNLGFPYMWVFTVNCQQRSHLSSCQLKAWDHSARHKKCNGNFEWHENPGVLRMLLISWNVFLRGEIFSLFSRSLTWNILLLCFIFWHFFSSGFLQMLSRYLKEQSNQLVVAMQL